MDDATVRSRLDLSDPLDSTAEEADALLSPSTTSQPDNGHERRGWQGQVALLIALVFLMNIGGFISFAPYVRLFESIICYKYYAANDPTSIPESGMIPEDMCKVDSIQDSVALLFGWQPVWDAIPTVALAIPYGSLSDRIGRKPVMMLCLVGMVTAMLWILLVCYMQWSVYVAWLSSAWLLIGGGIVMAHSTLFTMAADVTPPLRRTAVFLWLNAAIMCAELIGPAISSGIMRRSIWWVLFASFFAHLLTFVPVALLSETLAKEARKHHESAHVKSFQEFTISGLTTSLKENIRNAATFVFQDREVALVVCSNGFSGLGVEGLILLLQYVSKRYHWSIADAALLSTMRAAVNLVLFLFVVPALEVYLTGRRRLTAERANLEISRYSAVMLSLGFFIIGISPIASLMVVGLIVFTSGTGFFASIRSVGIAAVGGEKSSHIGKLFASMTVATSIGSMVTGPLVPLFFSWGQKIGEVGLGLPYIMLAFLLAISASLVFAVRTHKIEPLHSAALD